MKTPTTAHTLTIGQILVSMWGYDQTNVDFYEVTQTTRTTVQVRKLRGGVLAQRAHLTSRVEPIESDYVSAPFRRKVHTYGSTPSIAIESYANAYPWDGTPQTATHYA